MPTIDDLFHLPEVQAKIHFRARKTAKHSLFTSSDREDIFQDLALHLYRRLPRYNPQSGELSGFVHVVLLNRARTLIHQQERRLSTQTEWGHVTTEALNQEPVEDKRLPQKGEVYATSQVDLQVDLEPALSDLNPIQRSILQGCCEGRTITEIANQLNMPRSTLSSLLKKLRQHLKEGPLQIYLEKRCRLTAPEG